MRIAEIFHSVQGEGRFLGMPSVFIRTSGCNLRCVWCDTPYTSWKPEGKERKPREILSVVRQYRIRHVVITGGEPFLAREIEELAAMLKQRDHHITVETAATIFKPVSCDLISMSPKLSNSTPWKRENGRFARMHEEHRLDFDVMQKFIDTYDYQFKFVVDKKKDLDEILAIIKRLKRVDRSRVLMMAQATTKKGLHDKAPWIVDLCKNHGFGYTPRLQIELYGNRRGT